MFPCLEVIRKATDSGKEGEGVTGEAVPSYVVELVLPTLHV